MTKTKEPNDRMPRAADRLREIGYREPVLAKCEETVSLAEYLDACEEYDRHLASEELRRRRAAFWPPLMLILAVVLTTVLCLLYLI